MATDHYIVIQFQEAIWVVICGFLRFEYMREQNRNKVDKQCVNERGGVLGPHSG